MLAAMHDDVPPPEGIAPNEWAAWPPAAPVLITTLRQQVALPTARVQVLEQRLNQTSRNSSKPPSSDPRSTPPCQPRWRSRGWQPGHAGSTRERCKPERIVPLHPTTCPARQKTLDPALPDACLPEVVQPWDLPPNQLIITICCSTCAALVTAELPLEVRTVYGVRITAVVAHLHGTLHVSYRTVGERLHVREVVQALAEARMPESPWATAVLAQIDQLFVAWHAVRDGATDHAGLQQAMQPIQQAIHTALEAGRTHRWYKITALSQELLTWWEAFWTVVTHPGVEPTNNAAERVLRPAVIWRKQCFGTQSADGSRFVERILSLVTTCRQQGRNVWELLTAAVRAAMIGQPSPTMLPAP